MCVLVRVEGIRVFQKELKAWAKVQKEETVCYVLGIYARPENTKLPSNPGK